MQSSNRQTFRSLSPVWHARFAKGLTAAAGRLDRRDLCVVGTVWNTHKGYAGYRDCRTRKDCLVRVVSSCLTYPSLRPQAVRDCGLFCRHFEKVHVK